MKRVAQITLLVLLAIFLAVLVFAPKPWNIETILRVNLGLGLLLRDHVAQGVWSGAAFGFVVALLMLATVDLWVGSKKPIGVPEAIRNRVRSRLGKKKAGLLVLVAAVGMGAAGIAAYPRLFHSLWGDEDYTVRLHLLGHYKRDVNKPGFEDGRPFFRRLSWRDTAFGYRTTNNHFLYTIVGRVCLETWQKVKGVKGYVFSEPILRITPYILGLFSIAAWIGLATRVGVPWASIPMVLLLWCNPWFIRYISEARGYAYIFLFIPLGIWALVGALETGRWRNWVLYGLFQFLALYSWPGVAMQVVFVNLLVGGLLFWRSIRLPKLDQVDLSSKEDNTEAKSHWAPYRLEQGFRWAVTNTVCVLILIPLIAPAYPQIAHYLEETSLQLPVTGGWLANFHSQLIMGTPFVDYYAFHPGVNPLYNSVQSIARDHTSLVYVYLYVVYAFFLIGIFYFARRALYGGLLLIALLGAGVAFWSYGYFNEKYLFPWYFTYLQPFVLLLAGVGMTGVASFIGSRIKGENKAGLRRGLAIAGSVVVGASALYFSHFRLSVFRNHSIDKLRESVLYVRGDLDPLGDGMYDTLLAHVHYGAFCYDAHGFPVDKAFSNDAVVPGVTRMMRLSDTLGMPLFFTMGFPSDARSVLPQVMNMLDDRELFEPQRVFWSSEPQLVRQVFRYRGGFFPGSEKFDWTPPEWAEQYGAPVPPEMLPTDADRRAQQEAADEKAKEEL